MNEEVWRAIINCDPTYDGKFYYGVVTTGVFCRPSCRSKNPKRENVRVFRSISDAVAANFRPCKRCRPDQAQWPQEDLVQRVLDRIEKHYHEPVTLTNLAHMFHVSPYHLHRTFKRIVGTTPAEYQRTVRLKAAKKMLEETHKTVAEIAVTVGFANAAHFSTMFQRQFGLAPSAYRNQFQMCR